MTRCREIDGAYKETPSYKLGQQYSRLLNLFMVEANQQICPLK